MRTNIISFLIIVLGVFTFSTFSYAQSSIPLQQQKAFKGTVVSVSETNAVVEILNSGGKRQEVEVTLDPTLTSSNARYKPGDKVFLLAIADVATDTQLFYITDHNRTSSLAFLFIIFVITVVVVSKKWGAASLAGMVYSFVIIFKYILPMLLKGYNPLFVAISGTVLIAPVTFYLSHGLNRKTTVALASALITLFVTGVISALFINFSKLSGFGTEEAFFLQISNSGIDMRGILLAGIIVGVLGILDDVTISQSAIVFQLKHSIPNITDRELYAKAMSVGHDHIASTVNTLILVYTGAALPLLLLFLNSSRTAVEALSTELIADEVVRTLVGSIGLVLAVPISTFIAVFFSAIDQDSDSL